MDGYGWLSHGEYCGDVVLWIDEDTSFGGIIGTCCFVTIPKTDEEEDYVMKKKVTRKKTRKKRHKFKSS